MRTVVNILLVLLTFGLIYLLYTSISEPIQFRTAKEQRQRAVIDRLMDIREAQTMFVDITGQYAGSFEDLSNVLQTDSFMFVQIQGDPDDPNFTDFDRDTTYSPAIDSIQSVGIELDSLPFVPFGGGKRFEIFADTIQYESSLVNVVEVGTRYADFMGIYADPKYSRYDNSYEPAKTIKFGDRSRPVLSGNWEQ